MYPDAGPFRRELYRKHLDFFAATATHNEVAFIAANRIGKTTASSYMTACHLTGKYPHWWPGRKFDEPTKGICAGTTAKTTRDILQAELLGPPGSAENEGTGLIPGDCILQTSIKHGLANCYDDVHVRHVSGGVSVLQFKSFDQSKTAFEGTSQHFIGLDEECPEDVYAEALLRTMTTNGIVYLTFTPLNGLTPLVLSFLPGLKPTAEA